MERSCHNSLPVPLSPNNNTVVLVTATVRADCMTGLVPLTKR
jgi:hypothetical protein